ncbi:methyltransferase domain protein [Mycobacterium xenopi 4042]|uniref:Methyltransferase domain protein n=1 Tax=Mycobacterium xenopi 4042 TaxID=1299334 RepID=X7ZBY4_MYCXE|nr:methyltransferase domain protein [Mycobacterium xenopi 4042]
MRASGMALPFADDSVDICLSSNVAEHVPGPGSSATRCCASPNRAA